MCFESSELRHNSIKLMNQILYAMPNHAQYIFKDLDLDLFVKLNIFQNDGSNMLEIKNFIEHFLFDEEMHYKILKTFTNCLKNIESFEMTI
jgi:hypothetical protein